MNGKDERNEIRKLNLPAQHQNLESAEYLYD